MKTKPPSLVALFCCTNLAFACSASGQGTIEWHPLGMGVAEFGITSLVGGAPVQSPSALETGYNGAFVFGQDYYWAFAQSFTVLSDRTLRSIELRLANATNPAAQGQFMLAVTELDPASHLPGPVIGSVTAQAADYHYSLMNAPVSSFDFSSLNLQLVASKTYAWTLRPLWPPWSGSLYIHSGQQSLYPSGNTYFSSNLVPEPATSSLLMFGLAGLVMCRFGGKLAPPRC